MSNISLDEQLDLINDQNEIIGKIGKLKAHKEGFLHRIVIGELINSKGEYCFVKQARDRQDPGQYVSPIGGHVSSGEGSDEALIRECEEELGFTPNNLEYVGSTIYDREVINRHENHLFLVYKIHGDANPILNHESVSFKWFSVKEIQKLLHSNPQAFGAAWHHVFKNIFPEIYNSI